jgi:hypothetical protein
MTNHHRMLKAVLRGVVEAQKSEGIKCTLRNPEGQGMRLSFKLPLCFIIGDVEGQDVLCGGYQSHSTSRLSRECNCPTNERGMQSKV